MSTPGILSPYTEKTTEAVRSFLEGQRPYDMYGMMQYFMGFADESLAPAHVFGGKRFRSALCLLIADAYGGIVPALPAAVSVELFHNFTLIHDDIFDNDAMRRGRPTVWKLWGNTQAINTGDAQLILVFRSLSQGIAGNPERGAEALAFLTERYLEVIEGQYLDFALTDAPLGGAEVTLQKYFEMIEKKTAVLVGAATKAGGIMAGVSPDECEKLYAFGVSFGMAVQLHDDMMSIWGESAKTGKQAYGDIRERKKTLPVIHARDVLTVNKRERLLAIYGQAEVNGDEALEAVSLLDEADARGALEAKIKEYLDEAYRIVDGLSCTPLWKEKLTSLKDECMPR